MGDSKNVATKWYLESQQKVTVNQDMDRCIAAAYVLMTKRQSETLRFTRQITQFLSPYIFLTGYVADDYCTLNLHGSHDGISITLEYKVFSSDLDTRTHEAHAIRCRRATRIRAEATHHSPFHVQETEYRVHLKFKRTWDKASS